MNKEIYQTGEYLTKNPTWHTEDSPWKASNILKIIARNKLKPTTICEIGCGAGEILNQLYQQMQTDVSFTGYEISPQAFELCQTRSKERLQYKLANIIDDGNAFYDTVLAIDIFEHIEDYLGFLRKIKNKGIYKIFHIPLEMSVQMVLRSKPIMRARNEVGHLHYFSKETAIATLKDAGYEIIDHFYTAGMSDLPAKSLKTLLAKLPRKFLFGLNQDLTVRVMGGYSLMVLAK